MNSTMDYAERRMARQRAREARNRAYEARRRDCAEVLALLIAGGIATVAALRLAAWLVFGQG